VEPQLEVHAPAIPEASAPIAEADADLPSPAAAIVDGPVTAAQARLGSEGLARLRARHSEVLARISEKVTDSAKRDELKGEAERLNPDTWVTDAEVAAGLEAYEAVFESLRGVVGRRRKRRRRQPGSGDGETAQSVEPAVDADPADPESAREPDGEL
jgi:hypothetical protein